MQRITEPYLRDCHATRLFEGPILDDGDLGLDNDQLDVLVFLVLFLTLASDDRHVFFDNAFCERVGW